MRILVIDDERNIARMLAVALEADGHEVVAVESGSGALRQVQKAPFDASARKTAWRLAQLSARVGPAPPGASDVRLGQEDGLEVLAQLRRADAGVAVIMITAFASIPNAMEATRRGAVDYLPKPFTPDQVRLVLGRVEQRRGLERRVEELESLFQLSSAEPAASADPAMQSVLDLAHRTAASHASIILLGESGTGKSVLARDIHQHSLRAGRPFVTVSAPSLSRELLESDLFGHAKGAFTGATTETEGKVAAASGGTLYLDEIGELPLEIQPKLLRLLQEHEYERVGETRTRRADVRVISSTNRDLARAIKEGKFREDLYYRLNVVALQLPPLRDRPHDLERLAAAHLRFFARQSGKLITDFSPEAKTAMRRYALAGEPARTTQCRRARGDPLFRVTHGRGRAPVRDRLPNRRSANRGWKWVPPSVSLDGTYRRTYSPRAGQTPSSLEDAAVILGIDLATSVPATPEMAERRGERSDGQLNLRDRLHSANTA